jgi:autotransporter-associated beta strand protein
VTFSDSNSSIFGAVTNSSGGTLLTYGTSATNISFYGAVKNSGSSGSSPAGYVKITGSTVRWLGGLTNNGTYISDPAVNYFSGLAVGAGGLLQGGVGDCFFVTGTFTNAGNIDLGGSSEMVVQNGGTLTQNSGVLRLGGSATLTAGEVAIDGGTLRADGPLAAITSSLLYASPSASTYQGVLAGSGNSLTLDNPAALLILSGAGNSYTGGTYVQAGTLEITSAGGLPDGTALTVGADASLFSGGALQAAPAANHVQSVPEPGTPVLLTGGVLLAVLAAWRRRRNVRNRQRGTTRLPWQSDRSETHSAPHAG